MPSCFVKGCKSQWKKAQQDLTRHIFPRDADRIRTWLQILCVREDQLEDLIAKIISDRKGAYRICSRHFTRDSYEIRGTTSFLRKDAVPSLYLQEEEDVAEHSYAKRSRFSGVEFSEALQICSSEALIQQSPEVSVETSPQHTATPIESPIFSSQMYCNSEEQTESIIIQSSDIQVAIETETTALSLDTESIPRKSIKKKPVRHTRSIGTSTYEHPQYRHRSTQFDKSRGVRNKKTLVCRRPKHRSIAIQCMLLIDSPSETAHEEVSVLSTPEMSSDSEDMEIESDNESLESHDNYLRIQQDYENMRTAVITEIDLSSPGSQTDDSSMETDIKQELGHMDAIYRPIQEEKANRQGKMNENERMNIDVRELDSSLIYIPPRISDGDHVGENKFIVFESCLDQLLLAASCKAHNDCTGQVDCIKKFRIGSAITVSAKCTNGHNFHLWQSQPLIGRMPVGNILISAAILCSGSNFLKIDTFFRFLGVFSIGKTTHYTNQTTYLFPTINYHWQMERINTIKSIKQEPLVLVGDGQFHSPRLSAKCCMYSFMEYNSKKILDFQVEQLDTGTNRVNLERKVFQTALDRLKSEEVKIKVIATDRHVGIRKLLRDSYRDICHQFDVWHLAKSVGNKLLIASKRASCHELRQWVAPAKNHLKWSASTCGRNPQLLRELWTSIIYHCTDRHQWEEGELYKECFHSDISSQQHKSQDWLVSGSAAHCTLKDIALNSRLLKDIGHLSQFCHTGEIEVFHNTALKYRSKHNHYVIDSMVARTQLAALDHNFNVHRMQAVVKVITSYDQEEDCKRHRFRDNKSKKQWIVEKIYDPRNQDFVKFILTDVLELVAGNKVFSWQSRKPEVPNI